MAKKICIFTKRFPIKIYLQESVFRKVCVDTQAEISALEKNVDVHTKISGESLFNSCLPFTAHRRLKDTLPNWEHQYFL